MRAQFHIAWLICGGLGCSTVLGQTTSSINPSPTSNAVAQVPPTPPLLKSRIAYFRELLVMSPAELDRTLAEIAEPQRKVLQAKLREYTALPPEEREARLRATELRWYLRPLMATEWAPTNRAAQLALVPDEYRTLVKERLERWDALSRETQKEVLENEWTIAYFTRTPSGTQSQRESVLMNLPPTQREKLEKQLTSWLALAAEKRQRMCDNFQRFFELSPTEKERTLSALSDAERREMEKTLQAFEGFPPAQRRVCIDSFRKFASMRPDETAQFLRNAERWKEMTPTDRAAWRSLVTKLPPLPPGFGEPAPPPEFPKQKSGSPATPLPRGEVSLTNVTR